MNGLRLRAWGLRQAAGCGPRHSPLMMRAGLAVLFVAAMAMSAPGAAGPGGVLNAAGAQRMLSQRIVKAYCQIGLNVMPAEAARQLEHSIGRFDRNLAELSAAAASPAARAAHERLSAAWGPLKRIATAVIRRESAPRLSAAAEAVLSEAEQLTRVLQEESGATVAAAVAAAGRLRMLSQRMAKAYMLAAWGFDSAAIERELEGAAREFAAGLEALKADSHNTPEIRAELDKLALQWEWFRSAVSERPRAYHLIVAEASEAILILADGVTAMYEELAGR